MTEADPGGPQRPGPATRAVSLLSRHWKASLRTLLGLALLVVVLQNVEPTTLDLWFWSIERVPKLVLILISMAVGAGLWEILRRALRRSR